LSIFDQAVAAFSSYGPSGMLVGLLLVVFVDAIVIPLGPELLAIAIFSTNMGLGWAILIVAVVAIAQVGGTSLLYLVGKHPTLLPKYIKKVMIRYRSSLLIKDEKIIFVNCFVPVLPFLGAFVAVSKWNYTKSMSLVVLGGVIKYSLFLGLSKSFHYLFASGIAQKVSLLTVLCLLVASGIYAFMRRKAFGTGEVAVK
jgi:membrane protein YqaA with SNARE-associated domain